MKRYTIQVTKAAPPDAVKRKGEPFFVFVHLTPWAWDAVVEMSKRDRVSVCHLIARAVRHYAIAEGYHAPNRRPPAETEKPTPTKRGFLSRLFNVN